MSRCPLKASLVPVRRFATTTCDVFGRLGNTSTTKLSEVLCTRLSRPVKNTVTVSVPTPVYLLVRGCSVYKTVQHVLLLMYHVALHLVLCHWLPVEARITYKLCTLMYRIFNGTAPQYLAELCQLCSDDRLRSS